MQISSNTNLNTDKKNVNTNNLYKNTKDKINNFPVNYTVKKIIHNSNVDII
jgi:hypothetical protein